MDVTETIGELLPFAVVIAISPIPIIAVILVLFSDRARVNSLAFSAGWIVGVAAGLVLFTVLADTRDLGGDSRSDEVSWSQLILGLVLLALAVKQWRGRSATSEPPAWMAKVQTMGPLTALGLGLLLSFVNPKNLVLLIGAGVQLAAAGLDTSDEVVVIVVFTVVASMTVVGLTLAYLVAGRRIQPWLDGLRAWLTTHGPAVMATILLLIGVVLVGKGLGVLS